MNRVLKVDNSPNREEYIMMAVGLPGMIVFYVPHISYMIALCVCTLLVCLIQYNKKATIILHHESLEIRLKTGLITYRTYQQRFTKVETNATDIRFHSGGHIVARFDIEPAPDDDEEIEISVSLENTFTTLGNKKNYLQVFNEVKQFYQSADTAQEK